MRDRDSRRGSSDQQESEADVPTPGKRSRTHSFGSSDPSAGSAWPGKRSATQSLPSLQSTGAGGGTPLPDHVRSNMEASLGSDFSAVRVHEDSSADAVDAQAYARGTDLHFAPGRYDPDSQSGLDLIGHELVHVVQQSQGRATQSFQSKGNTIVDDSALEREADTLGAKAARGEYVGMFSGTSAGAVIQRKTKVNPIASAKKDKLAVLGDGTAANTGLSLPDLDAYMKSQADWFTEPSFAAAADRDAVWKVALLVGQGPHVTVALPNVHTGEIAKLAPADMAKLQEYCACFNTTSETIQLTTAAASIARVLELGQAVIDLKAFVPTPVLKIVIPEAGLIYLVDMKKLVELKTYYTTFKPTLETPAEWPFVTKVLDDGVAKYAALAPWIHDLHVFTVPTRDQLLKNIADKSRKRPVMLILFSALDWNTAFQQGKNIEAAAFNTKTLALVVQGMASIGAATGEVTRVADDYGQQTTTKDPKTGAPIVSPGRLGQVVIAGHGSDQSVEMGSPGTGAKANEDSHNVEYDQDQIDSSGDPKANGTEKLIDTIVSRMDPKDVDITFAGCLVNSHDVAANTNVSGGSAAAQKKLQAALAKHPNLAEYVRSRITAGKATGTVTAANASATFDSFNIDPATGKAIISNPLEPKLGGTKLEYLQQGIEPEGALRAAVECYADAGIGPAKTTTEIRTRVAGLAASTSWWEVITRTGFELCLPAKGDVNISKLLDVLHRIEMWFNVLWENESDPKGLADSVKAAEATKVFTAQLSTTNSAQDHVQVGVNEAWMKFDPSKGAAFMAALTASSFVRETFKKHLVRGIVDPQLGKLLPASATPTKGQLLLALTIAAQAGKSMPKPVRDLLRAAAGGAKTTAFPAGLGVPALLAPVSELGVLDDIGLAPSSAPSGGGSVDGNVDANGDGKNETYIEVSPHEATVTADVLNVRAGTSTTSAIKDTVKKGDIVHVMGKTEDGQWSFVDHGGKTGFMATRYLA